MQRIIGVILFLVLAVSGLNAQKRTSNPKVSLFRLDNISYRTNRQSLTSFQLDLNATRHFTQQPTVRQIRFELPFSDGNLRLNLREVELFAPGFKITDSRDRVVPEAGSTGKHYQYISADTLAAISIFEQEVYGHFTYGGQNYILGPRLGSKTEYVFFADDAFPELEGQMGCHTEDVQDLELLRAAQQIALSNTSRLRAPLPPVDVYFELDHYVYKEQKESIAQSVNYFAAIFNNVAAIYKLEEITLRIGQVKVWDTVDPYSDQNSLRALTDFRYFLDRQGNNYIGDLAFLISRYNTSKHIGPNGGRAGLNVLCSKSAGHGYANIFNYFEAFPAYSWTVSLIAHEIGHVIGAWHTHSCNWPGGPLDNCYCPEGSCPVGPDPGPGGGTIMSYCYLTKPVETSCPDLPNGTNIGVNFLKAFGPVPGALLRERIAAAACLEGKMPVLEPNLSCLDVGQLIVTKDQIEIKGLQIANTGYAPSPATTLSIFLSADKQFSFQDYLLLELPIPTIAPKSKYSLDTSFTYTGPFDRKLYVGYAIDVGGEIRETNEFDNYCAWEEPIEVVRPIRCGFTENLNIIDVRFNSFTIGWDSLSGVTSYMVRYQLQDGQSEWQYAETGPGSYIELVDLEVCGSYLWSVKQFCEDGNTSKWSPNQQITLPGCDAPYCFSYGAPDSIWIDRVSIDKEIFKSGNNLGYADFRQVPIPLVSGEDYPIKLIAQAKTLEEEEVVTYAVWVDWNQDLDFTDWNETIVADKFDELLGAAIKLSIPRDAESGNYRMRISVRSQGRNRPCLQGESGEVEEYLLAIESRTAKGTAAAPVTSSTAIHTNGSARKPAVSIFANPTSGPLTINGRFEETITSIQLEVYNTLGQLVYREATQPVEGLLYHQLDLSEHQTGIYFLQIKTTSGTLYRQKILLQR